MQTYLAKKVIFFLAICLNMCFGCAKEPSRGDGSFEYPQHMCWLRNKETNFQLLSLLSGSLVIDLSGIILGQNILREITCLSETDGKLSIFSKKLQQNS